MERVGKKAKRIRNKRKIGGKEKDGKGKEESGIGGLEGEVGRQPDRQKFWLRVIGSCRQEAQLVQWRNQKFGIRGGQKK